MTAAAQKQLAAALGRIPSGLFVLTVRHAAAETGMLASWVQQCAFDPPMLSVSLKRDRNIISWLSAESSFTLNILDDSQTDMIAHFGRGFDLDQAAFTGLNVERPKDHGPILKDALGFLHCRVAGHFDAGDHNLFLGRIVGGGVLNEGHPMIHIRKSGAHY